MSLHCRVKNDPDLIEALRRMAESEEDLGLAKRAKIAIQKVERGRHFYVPAYADVLRELARIRRFGSGISPFVGGMIWVEGNWKKHPHVKVPPVKGGKGKGGADKSPEHEWIQIQLSDLGIDLENRTDIEYPIAGGQVDVVWFDSRIAWEVDLSLQTRNDQSFRSEVRAGAGLTLVSVMDNSECKESLLHLPTVVIDGLKDNASKKNPDRYDFPDLFVNSVMTLNESGPSWKGLDGLKMQEFCSGLITGEWTYDDLPVAVWHRGHVYKRAWRRRKDVARFGEILRHREEEKRRREEAEARRRQLNAQREVLTGEAGRIRSEVSNLDARLANLSKVEAKLGGLDLHVGKHRRRFVKVTWATADEDLVRLQRAVSSFEAQWFRRLLGWNKRLAADIERRLADLRLRTDGELREIREQMVKRKAALRELEVRIQRLAG